MTHEFICRNNNNRRLIVIFAGWSTDASFYRHITHSGWDILVVSGYTDFNFNKDLLDGYSTVALFAWSLGVYAASRSFPFGKAAVTVAINGTEQPVDNAYGIPEQIFFGTSNTLNEKNLTKFRRRMAGSAFKDIGEKFSDLPIEELKAQLDFIGKHSKTSSPRSASKWNRVYASKSDMIFPFAAQIAAWQNHPSSPQIIETDAPHYIDLLTLIKIALPRHESVGKRFKKALPTYNDTASPQNDIANHLADIAVKHFDSHQAPLHRILEIGPGTGFLTRRFAATYSPEQFDFVELYELPPFNLAPRENYFVADAEEWVADALQVPREPYDAIISASTIQWFVNPERFFRNAAGLLKPGGMMLCSTFLPGNLRELQGVNSSGLVYRSAEEIKNMMPSPLSLQILEEKEIVAEFDSPRATLAHLIKTGVGGTAKSSLPVGELLKKLPTRLTYRPLYLLAVKN